MEARECVRYGLFYTLFYVGILVLYVAGVAIVSLYYQFEPPEADIGAMVGAGFGTRYLFLKRRMRLPTTGEYWALVLTSALVVVCVDFALGALVIFEAREYGLDMDVVLLLLGIGAVKGLLGNMLFYSRLGGEPILKHLRAEKAKADPTP